jgi:hypothetical protein
MSRFDCAEGASKGAQKFFSTLRPVASLQRQNSRLTALRQLPLRTLRFPGRVPEKHSHRAAGGILMFNLRHYLNLN